MPSFSALSKRSVCTLTPAICCPRRDEAMPQSLEMSFVSCQLEVKLFGDVVPGRWVNVPTEERLTPVTSGSSSVVGLLANISAEQHPTQMTLGSSRMVGRMFNKPSAECPTLVTLGGTWSSIKVCVITFVSKWFTRDIDTCDFSIFRFMDCTLPTSVAQATVPRSHVLHACDHRRAR